MITKIATLLNVSDSKEDKMYKSAIKLFKFSEVNGINLGFSESEHGAGFGEKLRKQVCNIQKFFNLSVSLKKILVLTG